MAAYVVVDVEVLERVGYEEYRRMAPASIELYGGRYLVRGGGVDTLEGEWSLNRLVILEFPDAGRARTWWDSKEYRAARNLRQRTARTRMILAEGIITGASGK